MNTKEYLIGIILFLGVIVILIFDGSNRVNNAEKRLLRTMEKSFCDPEGKQKKIEVYWLQPTDHDQSLEKRYRCVPK